jgi:uncharacterized damage-inducible protein DinB
MEFTRADSFLAYFEGIRRRTRQVALLIPEDRLEWAHRPGAFTLGDLVRHLAAIERWMFAENAAGRPSRYPGHGRELAEGKQGVLDYLDRMHAEAVEIIGALSEEQLQAPALTPAGAAMPAWKWLRAMVEHEVHHRGQIYLLLGMLGVKTPPIFGLSEEEVRARSVA